LLLVITIALVAASVETAAGQNDLRTKVQYQQRLAREKIERARREAEWRRLHPEARTPVRHPSSAAAKLPNSAPSRKHNEPETINEPPPEYAFAPGKAFAYSFVLETTSGEQRSYLAGIAAFRVEDAGDSSLLSASDNLQYVSSLASLASGFPRGSSMVKAALHVDEDGIEPVIEDTLPHMLGRPHDWFFPPLPPSAKEPRTKGYTVEYGSFLDRPSRLEKSARGHFQWEVKPTGASKSRLTMRDSRYFRTDDRSQEFVGSGQIDFDLANGLMTSRTFRGKYTLHGLATEISLRVERLSE
jgi:hypothetical protein